MVTLQMMLISRGQIAVSQVAVVEKLEAALVVAVIA
jgi:hypothetical protein